MSRTRKTIRWKHGTPCPLCGKSVKFTEMLEHMTLHKRASGIIFMDKTIYTSVFDLSEEKSMSEDIVYEGKLCTIRRLGEGFWVETDTWAQYEPDELLSELQLVIAAVLEAKA